MRRVAAMVGACALAAGCAQAKARLGSVNVQSLADVGSAKNIGIASLPIGAAKEREIGHEIAATVAGRYHVLQEPALTRYVALVGQTVAEQSVRKGEVEFSFGVLDTDEVNAFSSPGGYVLVTRGALALMQSESELAGVLAHEVAHVDEKQVLNEVRRGDVLKTVQTEAQVTGDVLSRVAAAGASVLFTGLKREDELAADSIGQIYAAAAGYRADGLVTFVKKLGTDEGPGTRLDEIRATHPPASDRVAALERQLERSKTSGGAVLTGRFRENVKLSRRTAP